MTECWHFDKDLCKYGDPRLCNHKSTASGMPINCPRQDECDALDRKEREDDMDALEAQGQAEMDAIAKHEEDRAREEAERLEWEYSQGPEGDEQHG